MKRSLVAALATIAVVAAGACAASPTEPGVRIRPGLFLDGDPIPCDSTIITDGTCRNGFIVPWSLSAR